MIPPTALRASLLHFFDALLNPSPSTCDAAVHTAAAAFSAVARTDFDRAATPSDAEYARFVSLLDVVSIPQLRKVCAGFRTVDLAHAYRHLNAASVDDGAGIRALRDGCRRGIRPVALSYRHCPHDLPASPCAGSGGAACVAAHGAAPCLPQPAGGAVATVDRETAERFERSPLLVDRSAGGGGADDGCAGAGGRETVVWIDRAVRGLSTDGDWFVRGLMPYCVVPIAVAHSGTQTDYRRPWIWLEWRLSSHSNFPRSGGIVGAVDPMEMVLIALQAMFLPHDMLANYEYASEMESVIRDMFFFGLAVTAGISTETDARKTVALWSEYKIGITVLLACRANEGNMRNGAIRVDDRDPFRTGLFRAGLPMMLSTIGARIPSPPGLHAYAIVGGGVVVAKEFGGRLALLTRLSADSLRGLLHIAESAQISGALQTEAALMRQNLGLDGMLPTFDHSDELVLLASCRVWLAPRGKRRERSVDDSEKPIARESEYEVAWQFDAHKAWLNSERKASYLMRQWLGEIISKCDGRAQECDIFERGEHSMAPQALFADYNRGTLRWTALLGDGTTAFRRFRFGFGNDERSIYSFATSTGEAGSCSARLLADQIMKITP